MVFAYANFGRSRFGQQDYERTRYKILGSLLTYKFGSPQNSCLRGQKKNKALD
jgi:hypothetical protein